LLEDKSWGIGVEVLVEVLGQVLIEVLGRKKKSARDSDKKTDIEY